MKSLISLQTLLNQTFVGKTLISLEFHKEDKDAGKFNKKIIKALAIYESDHPGVELVLEDNSHFFVYENENVEMK